MIWSLSTSRSRIIKHPAMNRRFSGYKFVRLRAMRPIFVHCNAGEGRTSTFCALVRIAQGWPLDSAIAEQVRFGFDPDGEHKEQARFLERFSKRDKRAIPTL